MLIIHYVFTFCYIFVKNKTLSVIFKHCEAVFKARVLLLLSQIVPVKYHPPMYISYFTIMKTLVVEEEAFISNLCLDYDDAPKQVL